MAVALDTLAQAKRFREAGFNEEQAEALAAGLRDAAAPFDTSVFATKADIDALKANVATKADLAELKADVKAEIATLATKAEIATLATKADFAALKADVATKSELAAGLATLKAELLQWIIGLVIGALVLNAFVVIGSLLAMAKLLEH